uniref:Uncharacterized protein n=1 Tax=Arundo donax TaxID=35708 RepID=A0A0A9ELM1_ARUDO
MAPPPRSLLMKKLLVS